jgi:acid phosphatase type 7
MGGPAGGSAFDRWPYLQRVEASAFELLWTTPQPADFRVVVTEPGGRVLASAPAVIDPDASPPESAHQYTARLQGLPTGEMICYQVVADGKPWTRPTGIMTAPSADATVRFVALGDLGKRSPDQFAVARQLRRVQYDFVLVTGDLAYDRGKRIEFERYFFDVYPDIASTVPFFVTSGNHEYRTEDARPFREAFSLFDNGGPHGTDRWYSFDWGPVHVAVLDTEIREPVQAQWLDADLAAADRPWTIVMQHRPAYSSGHHGSDSRTQELFAPVYERHGVAMVLAGHDHNYERTLEIGGVVHVVTGGGGRGTRRTGRSDFTALSARVAHFVWLEASPSSLRMVAVDATGQQFDSVRLTR